MRELDDVKDEVLTYTDPSGTTWVLADDYAELLKENQTLRNALSVFARPEAWVLPNKRTGAPSVPVLLPSYAGMENPAAFAQDVLNRA